MPSEILNCRCCGGPLDNNSNLCVCKHCGTANFISDVANKNIIQLNRANRLRQESDFDNAARIYDNILSENTPTADILWYRTLCEYGIEYVEDPLSHKYFPTLHRICDEKIIDNSFFKEALELSDSEQKKALTKEAEYIEEIQDKYLNIAADEKPYDAFICYKETDVDTGNDTEDVKLAEELYHELTGKGYKVFFARETLKEKLSIDYEPYIFAALKSARAMAVIGTRSEYFTSVWVKNEWGRFLKLMDTNPDKKMFFACYDPEELPRAFASKQAQILGEEDAIKNLAANMVMFLREGKGSKRILKETTISEEQKRFDKILSEKSEHFTDYLEKTDFGKRKKEVINNIEKELKKLPQTNKKYMSYFNIGAVWVLSAYLICMLVLDVINILFFNFDVRDAYGSPFSSFFIFSSFLLLDIGILLLLLPSGKILVSIGLILAVTAQIIIPFVAEQFVWYSSLTVADLLMTIIVPILILYVGLFNKKYNKFFKANNESYKETCAQIEILKSFAEGGEKEFSVFAVKELLEYKKEYKPSEEVKLMDYQFDAVKPLVQKHIDEDVKKYSDLYKNHSGSQEISKRRMIITIIYLSIAIIIGLINIVILAQGPLQAVIQRL